VIWPPKLLQGNEHLLTFNPFYYFLDLLRLPLMGQVPSADLWTGTTAMVALLCVVSLVFVARYRWRVAYWI